MKILVGILLIIASLITIGVNVYTIWFQVYEYGELYNYTALWHPFESFVFLLLGVVFVFDKKGN